MTIEFLEPEKVLKTLELKENLICADFGCGSGGWVIPLAKILKKGKVYAIDVLEEALSALKGKIRFEKLDNIEFILANVEKVVPLSDESCDWVLMTNLLFQCEDIEKVLKEGKRVLRKGGKILIVDWIKDNPLTKEIEWLDFEKVKKIAERLNLNLEKEWQVGEYHLALIFSK